MLARIAFATITLAPLLQAQAVTQVNGPLAGNVSLFTWTPDSRYILYGAARDIPEIDVITSVRVADGSEVVYEPYLFFYGTARTGEFVFLPDPELVGVRIYVYDGMSFPPTTAEPLHILERATALPVRISSVTSPRFLDDGRMTGRTSYTAYRGSTYSRAWVERWDSASTPLEISPSVQPDNHVSLVLPAPQSGVAVFGWRDTFYSANDAELLAVPLDGGAPVPLTPPPPGSQRTSVHALHVRSSDELVIYWSDEVAFSVFELWAVPVDGSLPPRRLSPPLVPQRDLANPTVTPDERHVVFTSDAGALDVYELWSADIDAGTSVLLSGPMVAGGDVGDAYHDDFWISPDSTRVVYLADQEVDGVFELFSAPIDGHAPAVRLHAALSASDDVLTTVRFTPDGRFVVFAVRTPSGVALVSALADGRGTARVLNWPFPPGGGVREDPSGIFHSVALDSSGRQAFFLGEQDVDGVVELYSVPIDASAAPHKWNAPLVAGGNVTRFALRPIKGAVLYSADQDVDARFELYLSVLPETPPPRTASGSPTRTGSAQVP